MQYKITMDEVRLVVPAVHDRTATYTARVPEHEACAHRIATEAGRWLAFASERTRMTPAAMVAKALDSTAFSVAAGAAGFAVPSKLVGVKAHQRALWQIVRDGYRTFDELELETATTEGVRVSYGDVLLGEVQPKHLRWLRPLVPFGLTVHLARITGHEVDGRTLGVNIVVGHVGPAIAALADALGTSGDGAPGDGASCVTSTVFPAPALPARTGSGDGASGRLRLVVPEENATPDPLDVVLVRALDGTARALVAGTALAHVVRHSPSGVEWGYGGSGPADLARSVLLAITDEATADRLYQHFKAEIVARVPFAGGVLRAAHVHDWVARQPA